MMFPIEVLTYALNSQINLEETSDKEVNPNFKSTYRSHLEELRDYVKLLHETHQYQYIEIKGKGGRMSH